MKYSHRTSRIILAGVFTDSLIDSVVFGQSSQKAVVGHFVHLL